MHTTPLARRMQDGVRQWAAVGPACSGKHTATTSLVLYHSRWANGAQRASRTMRRVLHPYKACFRAVLQEHANLSAQEDSYPGGASRMVHRLFRARMLGVEADAFFLLESDLVPLRQFWLDALYHDALAGGRFWIRGSILSGNDLDKQAARKLSPDGRRRWADRLAGSKRVPLVEQLWEPVGMQLELSTPLARSTMLTRPAASGNATRLELRP